MLPDNAEELVFSYNLVSEEPMEYVGSVFDDTFIVIMIVSIFFRKFSGRGWADRSAVNTILPDRLVNPFDQC